MAIDTGGGEKRLKRGLHDISPLFRPPAMHPSGSVEKTARAVPTGRSRFDVQFLTVSVPDHEGDAFLANAFVASRILRKTSLHASLVSLVPGPNARHPRVRESSPAVEMLDSRFSRYRLSPEELWTFAHAPAVSDPGFASPPRENAPSFLVFLEFEPSQFRSLARVAPLLDRVVLFVQPQVDSLREAYRLIKVFWSLNREIEFLLLFRGGVRAEGGEGFLYERFSLITSRFLGLSPGWLGELSLPEKGGFSGELTSDSSCFRLEPVLSGEGLRRPLSPEKMRFWGALGKVLTRHLPPEAFPR